MANIEVKHLQEGRTIEIKQVIRHPDGAAVIVPVDPDIPSFFVSAEEMEGRDVQPGHFWYRPDDKQQ